MPPLLANLHPSPSSLEGDEVLDKPLSFSWGSSLCLKMTLSTGMAHDIRHSFFCEDSTPIFKSSAVASNKVYILRVPHFSFFLSPPHTLSIVTIGKRLKEQGTDRALQWRNRECQMTGRFWTIIKSAKMNTKAPTPVGSLFFFIMFGLQVEHSRTSFSFHS